MILRPLLLLALSTPAIAQDRPYEGGIDAHGFDLAAQDGDVRDAYTVHRPGTLYRNTWFVGGLLEYASKPLVLVTDGDTDDPTLSAALDQVFGLNLTGGVAPHERVRLTASLPLFFTSTSFDESQGAAVGDLRLDGMIIIVPAEDDLGFSLGVVPWIDLPTGATSKFVGRGKVGGGATVAGSYAVDRVTGLANLGLQIDPTVDELENLEGADAFVLGLGGNYLLTPESSLGLETRFLLPFSANAKVGTGSPGEVIASYRQRLESGAFFSGGLAAGLSSGAGAATYRIFLGGGFGKTGPGVPKDTDLDGITDDVDACIDQPETVNEYLDTDGCPDELATLNVVVTQDGQVADGATVSATGPGEDLRTGTSGSDPWSLTVPPEGQWAIQATKGKCRQGKVSVPVQPGDNQATVALELIPAGDLGIFVHDAAGKPIPDAVMTWESTAPDCLDSTPPIFGSDGRASAAVGEGDHKVLVGAPGYRVVEREVTMRPGGKAMLDITLEPTKLRVEANRIVILDKVQFETAKAVIKPVSYQLLNEVAEIIIRNPKAGRVEVQGHTDSRGSDSYNLDLSDRRATAVREYLVNRGVQANRLIAVGYGETKPIDTNATAAGRAQNRRVEFLLIDQKSQQIQEPAP